MAIWRIVWIVGLIILANLSLIVENHFNEIASTTFKPGPLIWLNSIIPFIFGIYLALIFVNKWTLNADINLLCFVFIPSLLISFYYPIVVLFSDWGLSIPISEWIIRISNMELFGIIAGLTLIIGTFSNQLRG